MQGYESLETGQELVARLTASGFRLIDENFRPVDRRAIGAIWLTNSAEKKNPSAGFVNIGVYIHDDGSVREVRLRLLRNWSIVGEIIWSGEDAGFNAWSHGLAIWR